MRIKYEYWNSPKDCVTNNNVLCSHIHTHSAYKIRQNGKRIDVTIDCGVPNLLTTMPMKYVPRRGK